MLRDAPLEGEIDDQQDHDHRTGDVLEQRGVVEAGPKQPRAHEVDAVAERGAEAAAGKYDQENHTCSLLAPRNKKPPCGGSRTDSYRTHRAVGVISHCGRFRGTPSPSPSTLATSDCPVNASRRRPAGPARPGGGVTLPRGWGARRARTR